MTCAVCNGGDWPIQNGAWKFNALKYALENGWICESHKKMAEEIIESEMACWPEMPKKVFKNWQEPREPGSDDW